MQIKIASSLVTVKGDVVTLNRARVTGFDGTNFTLEIDEQVQAQSSPASVKVTTVALSKVATPAKVQTSTTPSPSATPASGAVKAGAVTLSEEALKARAAAAAMTKKVKAACAEAGIEFVKGMTLEDVEAKKAEMIAQAKKAEAKAARDAKKNSEAAPAPAPAKGKGGKPAKEQAEDIEEL